jgi:hypothetical protein
MGIAMRRKRTVTSEKIMSPVSNTQFVAFIAVISNTAVAGYQNECWLSIK